MSDHLGLGKIITTPHHRDAIHIAVAPVVANEDLYPGARVQFVEGSSQRVTSRGHAGQDIGIIDPFLTEAVREGQRCWLFLFPNTVTSLRHEWTHPAFDDEPAEPFPSRVPTGPDTRAAFLADIAADPSDEGVRAVFADWLEDNGKAELAGLYRGGAKEWLTKLAHEHGIYPEYGRSIYGRGEERDDATPEECYAELMRQLEDNDSWDYITIVGTDYFRDGMNDEEKAMLWMCYEVVTGKPVSDHKRHTPFSCSC